MRGTPFIKLFGIFSVLPLQLVFLNIGAAAPLA